jgi:hypothetical protein
MMRMKLITLLFPLLREHIRFVREFCVRCDTNVRVRNLLIYRWRSTHRGDVLDLSLRAKRDGIGESASHRGMETSRPFAFHIRRVWLQLLLVGLTAYCLASGLSAVRSFPNYGTVQFQFFRLVHSSFFTPLRESGVNHPISSGEALSCASTAAVSVRLLRRGCEIRSHVFKFDLVGSWPSLSFAEPLELDGMELEVKKHRERNYILQTGH